MNTTESMAPEVFEILERGILEALGIHRQKFCIDCGAPIQDSELDGLCYGCALYIYE